MSDHTRTFYHFICKGWRFLYLCFSARYVTHVRSRLYQPVRQYHAASCCRSDAEHQYRPADVIRTGFHGPYRDSARYLMAGGFRLLPYGFWCQNRRESDPGSYLRWYRDVFFAPAAHLSERIILPTSAVADHTMFFLWASRSKVAGSAGNKGCMRSSLIGNFIASHSSICCGNRSLLYIAQVIKGRA